MNRQLSRPGFIFKKRVFNTEMKFLIFIALSFIGHLSANQEELKNPYETPILAPLAPIEEEFPLAVSLENKELYMEGKAPLEEEKSHIERALLERSFPWQRALIVGCIAILFFLLATLLKTIRKKSDSQTKKELLQKELAAVKKTLFSENFKESYNQLGRLLSSHPEIRSQITPALLEKIDEYRFSLKPIPSAKETEEELSFVLGLFENRKV